jgi:hypothetical protein
LPLSSDSSSASSSVCWEMRSPIRQISLPRSEGVIAGQGPDSNARRAAFTAASMSAASPSATRAMVAPVAGILEDWHGAASVRRALHRLGSRCQFALRWIIARTLRSQSVACAFAVSRAVP